MPLGKALDQHFLISPLPLPSPPQILSSGNWPTPKHHTDTPEEMEELKVKWTLHQGRPTDGK